MGASSTGYVPQIQYSNMRGIQDYIKNPSEFSVESIQVLDTSYEIAREMMTKLRFTSVNMKEMNQKYNTNIQQTFSDLILELQSRGLIEVENSILCLTEKAKKHHLNVIPMMFAPSDFLQKIQHVGHPIAQKLVELGGNPNKK